MRFGGCGARLPREDVEHVRAQRSQLCEVFAVRAAVALFVVLLGPERYPGLISQRLLTQSKGLSFSFKTF